MKRNSFLRLKSFILLLIFSLTTVVSSACALGKNMSCHSMTTQKVFHIKYEQKKANKKNTNEHCNSEKNKKDNCCKEVQKFPIIDKYLPQPYLTLQPAFIGIFFNSLKRPIPTVYTFIPNTNYFGGSHHPPIPDIRIAVQSFQI